MRTRSTHVGSSAPITKPLTKVKTNAFTPLGEVINFPSTAQGDKAFTAACLLATSSIFPANGVLLRAARPFSFSPIVGSVKVTGEEDDGADSEDSGDSTCDCNFALMAYL